MKRRPWERRRPRRPRGPFSRKERRGRKGFLKCRGELRSPKEKIRWKKYLTRRSEATKNLSAD